MISIWHRVNNGDGIVPPEWNKADYVKVAEVLTNDLDTALMLTVSFDEHWSEHTGVDWMHMRSNVNLFSPQNDPLGVYQHYRRDTMPGDVLEADGSWFMVTDMGFKPLEIPSKPRMYN